MARLIPSFIDDASPSGERDVYNMLARAPDSWVILHSLDLAPWNHSRRTEIDFLVLIPDAGILCIEVKSQPAISFDGERWHPLSIRRSPIKQAMDARFALQRRLWELAPYARAIPIVHLCLFPNAAFDVEQNLSVRPWEIMDSRSFRSARTATELAQNFRARTLQAVGEERLTPLKAPIQPQIVDKLVALCVPIQRRRPEAFEEIRHRRMEIDSLLREQQKPILQLAQLNDRLAVAGAAGTGKTLVAMELALRESEAGRRVGLVCFNTLIGDWMRADLEKRAPPNLVCDSVTRLLTRVLEIAIPEQRGDRFWDEQFEELVEERVTDPDFADSAMFDYLIVDEAQDILARHSLWSSLFALLVGGLASGRFAVFCDLEHQTLSGRTMPLPSLAELQRETSLTQWHLSENCRNHQLVGSSALSLSGYPMNVYSAYLRSGGNLSDVAYVSCMDRKDELAKLKGVIQDVRSKGYKDSQITLLSFRASAHSAARQLVNEGFRMALPSAQWTGMQYTSVHAYKGLENEVIIVTDVELGHGDLSRALFYTALTRSTGIVRVLCRQEDALQLIKWSQSSE